MVDDATGVTEDHDTGTSQGMSRRGFLRAAGLTTTAVWVAPSIVSLSPALATTSPGPGDEHEEDDHDGDGGKGKDRGGKGKDRGGRGRDRDGTGKDRDGTGKDKGGKGKGGEGQGSKGPGHEGTGDHGTGSSGTGERGSDHRITDAGTGDDEVVVERVLTRGTPRGTQAAGAQAGDDVAVLGASRRGETPLPRTGTNSNALLGAGTAALVGGAAMLRANKPAPTPADDPELDETTEPS